MGRLFGTDGARGVAITELTCELAMQIGRAAALVLTKEAKHKAKIVIGKDTRISSDILEAALCAGICSVGADAVQLGVIPTPGRCLSGAFDGSRCRCDDFCISQQCRI